MRDDSGNGMSRRSLIVKGLAAGAAATLMSGAGKLQAAKASTPARVQRQGSQRRPGPWRLRRRVCWSEVIERLQAAGVTRDRGAKPADFGGRRRGGNSPHPRAACQADDPGGSLLRRHRDQRGGRRPHVVGLVYVAARAPDAGEDYTALVKTFPTPPANAGLVYKDGFGSLTKHAFLHDFANGVNRSRARPLYAVQGHVSATLFGDRTTGRPGVRSRRGTPSPSGIAPPRRRSSTSSPSA